MADTAVISIQRPEPHAPWGFRIHGGKEYGMPISVQKVHAGSLAEKAGLKPGDVLVSVQGRQATSLRHRDAMDAIAKAGNRLDMEVYRSGTYQRKQSNVLQPTIKSVPSFPGEVISSSPRPRTPPSEPIREVSHLSLNHIEHSLSQHTEVLSSGVVGINFMKPQVPINQTSEVLKLVLEEDTMRKDSPSPTRSPSTPIFHRPVPGPVHPHRTVAAPKPAQAAPVRPKPSPSPPQETSAPTGPPCSGCGRHIGGPYVRAGEKCLHPECFRCTTCGMDLQSAGGYHAIAGKLYCDIHATQAAKLAAASTPSPPRYVPLPESSLNSSSHSSQFETTRSFEQKTHLPQPTTPTNVRCMSPTPFQKSAPIHSPVSPPGGKQTNILGQTNVSFASKLSAKPIPAFQPAFTQFNKPPGGVSTGLNNKSFVWPPPRPTSPLHTQQRAHDSLSCYQSTQSYSSLTGASSTQNSYSAFQPISSNSPPWEQAPVPHESSKSVSFASSFADEGGRLQKEAAYSATVSVSQTEARQNHTTMVQFAETTKTETLSSGGSILAPSAGTAPVTPSFSSYSDSLKGAVFRPIALDLGRSQSPRPHSPVPGKVASDVTTNNSFFEPPTQPPAPTQATNSFTTLPETGSAKGDPSSASKAPASKGASGVLRIPKRGRGTLKPKVAEGTRIPICAVCDMAIRGPFIVALNRSWCPDHFLCANSNCRQSLQDIGFVEENEQLYCENCFENYLAPLCHKCNNRVKKECLIALEKQWHPDCFVCGYCNQPLGNNNFYLEDGIPYCEKDWTELFTTKCIACNFPIEAGDRWLEAIDATYHVQCFNCAICKKNLEGQTFLSKGGKPICKSHARF